jgi:1-aminocyclopropane-1-carboxylate deaminase
MIDFEKIINLPTPIVQIFDPIFDKKNLKIFVKRDDLTHELVSGNKFRKLKYNLIDAKKNRFTKILTFGGAFSNHIAAVAEAAFLFGFEATGIIRGEELNENSSPTLAKASAKNMKFEFVNRTEYRDKVQFIEKYKYTHFIIPEGGTNQLALAGMAEMVEEILQIEVLPQINTIFTAVATGGTMAGILSNKKYGGNVIGIPVLKDSLFLKNEIESLLEKKLPENATLIPDYHFGGYAKYNPTLLNFIDEFESKHGFLIDQVYTAKLFFGLYDLIKKDYFTENQVIVVIHTGGVQGKTKKMD